MLLGFGVDEVGTVVVAVMLRLEMARGVLHWMAVPLVLDVSLVNLIPKVHAQSVLCAAAVQAVSATRPGGAGRLSRRQGRFFWCRSFKKKSLHL